MSNLDQTKVDFETWAKAKGINLTKSSDGTYVYNPAFYAFMGWCESGTCVDLPDLETCIVDINDI